MALIIAAVLLLSGSVKAIYKQPDMHRPPLTAWTPHSTNPECNEDHSSEMYKPLLQWKEEHPGVDGYCYFERAAREKDPTNALWLHPIQNHHNYVEYGMQRVLDMQRNLNLCPEAPKIDNGFSVEVELEYKTIVTSIDCQYYLFDDLYFYALGWLKNMGVDGRLMSNYTAWQNLAESECKRIYEITVPTDEESTLGYNIDHNEIITSRVGCSPKSALAMFPTCQPISVRELRLHALTKCGLGHGAEEMAIGYSHGCLLDGVQIGHGKQCDTPTLESTPR